MPLTQKPNQTRFLIGVLLLLAASLSNETAATNASASMAPTIRITLVPPDGEGPSSIGTIGGTVSGVDFEKHRVVIYSHTNMWWVQPQADAPLTYIQNDGKWETEIHLGHIYAALLVKADYKPRPTTNILPQVTGKVLAIARARPTN